MFQVGGRYRNRHGEYEVLAIEGPNMTIRFLDGEVWKDTPIDVQARIWENIQIDERTAQPPASGPSGTPKAKSRRETSRFQGLQEHDFKKRIEGTSWRGLLGNAIADELSLSTRYEFKCHAVYPRAEVHLFQPQYYAEDDKQKEAKFAIDLDDARAFYGFYIEKNRAPMDDTWDWTRFIRVFEDDAILRGQVVSAMRRLGLHGRVIIYDSPDGNEEITFWPSEGEDSWVWQAEVPQKLSWGELLSKLKGIERHRWCDLYIGERLDKEQAIAEGPRIIDRAVTVYRALLPLYIASTRQKE